MLKYNSTVEANFRGMIKPVGEVLLAPGSLYLLEGPARWEYQHRILPVKSVRYSITLRRVKTAD
jgi:alkylated DNA repair dioxygenase AlkB